MFTNNNTPEAELARALHKAIVGDVPLDQEHGSHPLNLDGDEVRRLLENGGNLLEAERLIFAEHGYHLDTAFSLMPAAFRSEFLSQYKKAQREVERDLNRKYDRELDSQKLNELNNCIASGIRCLLDLQHAYIFKDKNLHFPLSLIPDAFAQGKLGDEAKEKPADFVNSLLSRLGDIKSDIEECIDQGKTRLGGKLVRELVEVSGSLIYLMKLRSAEVETKVRAPIPKDLGLLRTANALLLNRAGLQTYLKIKASAVILNEFLDEFTKLPSPESEQGSSAARVAEAGDRSPALGK